MKNKLQVKKRDGRIVEFDATKIYHAISKAYESEIADEERISELTNKTVSAIKKYLKEQKDLSVEKIQDIVEDTLLKNKETVLAKNYIRYRAIRNQVREASTDLMKLYKDIYYKDANEMDLKRDNANINGDASMGIMLKCGTEGNKYFIDNFVLPRKFAEADKDNYIHIHDKDFSLITWNCTQVDLLKLFHGGFSTGHGFLREPNSIRAYAALECIAIQSSQNDYFGGQSINAHDFAMAEGVRKTFAKLFKKYLKIYSSIIMKDIAKEFNDAIDSFTNIKDVTYINNESVTAAINDFAKLYSFDKTLVETVFTSAFKLANADTEEETHQAMEAMIHNFNTLHSRCGSQVPFSSINFGTDTSNEGRLVIKATLDAINEGLGHGETAIFPISIMKLKRGINYNPGDVNYDLFEYACKVSAKRLFPNFLSEDAPYNACFYEEGDYNTEVAVMGCRTKTMSNVNGRQISGGRGNFSFTTINLPKLAIEANGNIDKFYELFDKYIYLSKEYLEYRYSIIAKKHGKNYPFSIGQHIAYGSENIGENDTIEDALKQCSISIGFCGLAECLVALTGHHHGETEEARKLGYEIIKHLRDMTDKFTKEDNMNWSTFSTPAESTAGSFARSNRKNYGVIKGVTDREYLTNSFHVPVYYQINAFDKIDIEAPYHELCNAG